MKQNLAPVSEHTDWSAGWWRAAKHYPSPNFGDRPAATEINLIVLHSISLPPGEYGAAYVQALFTNRLEWSAHPYFETIRGLEVSSHFFIRRTGRIEQYVSCDARAWHAGSSHFMGHDNCNDYSVGIELEGLEGTSFEPAQYMQLTHLCLALKQRYPIAHVVGHEHVAPGRKFDPGKGFDWALLQKNVAWPLQCFPALSIL